MSTIITPARVELYRKACRHLSRKCPVLKGLIKKVGPCTLVPVSDDPFTVPTDQLDQVRVDATMVGGELVYERPDAAALSQ